MNSINHHLQDALDYACRLGRAIGGHEDVKPLRPALVPPAPASLKAQVDQIILNEIDRCGGDVTKVAKRVGISRGTVYVHAERYGYVTRRKVLRLVAALVLCCGLLHAAPFPDPPGSPPPPPASVDITLEWLKSLDPTAVGYRIYVGPSTRLYTNSYAVGNVTNATLTGLKFNQTYFFAATAYNATGEESIFSNEVMATATMNLVLRIPAVTNLNAAGTNWFFSHYAVTVTNPAGNGFYRLGVPTNTFFITWK